jgi:hypothetical protein
LHGLVPLGNHGGFSGIAVKVTIAVGGAMATRCAGGATIAGGGG